MTVIEFDPIVKADWEEMYRLCQFKRDDGRGWLSDSTLTEGAVTVEPWPGGTPIAAMVDKVSVYGETQVKYWLAGGVAGNAYLVRIRATDTYGQKFEARIKLKVV